MRLAPADWDARYNLERALWLAPETPVEQEDADVKKRSNVKLRGARSEPKRSDIHRFPDHVDGYR